MNDARNARSSLAGMAPDIDVLTELLTGNVETAAMSADIAAIIEDPEQPRRDFETGALEELADSIRVHGVLQPLLVRKRDAAGQYWLVAGARRHRAARLAGLARVPIREVATADIFAVQMVENLQRADLAPLEVADGIKSLIDSGKSQAQISKALGKSKPWVNQYAAIADMPAELRQIVERRGCAAFSALSRLLTAYRADPAETVGWLEESSGPITRDLVQKVSRAKLFLSPHEAQGIESEQPAAHAGNNEGGGVNEGQLAATHAPKVAAPMPRWHWSVDNRPVEPSFSMMPSDQGTVWVKDIGTKASRLVKAGDLKLVGAEVV